MDAPAPDEYYISWRGPPQAYGPLDLLLLHPHDPSIQDDRNIYPPVSRGCCWL
jgi:hypothetical protein